MATIPGRVFDRLETSIELPTVSPPAPQRYALLGDLLWRALDGEWVIFSVKTGSVLQADPLTAALCSLLETQPASASELLEHIATAIEMSPDAALMDGVERALVALQDGGFVQRHLPP